MNSKTKQTIKKIFAAFFGFALLSQAFFADVALAGVYPIFSTDLKVVDKTRGDTTWQDSISSVNPGDTVKLSVYYCNTVSGTTAQNAQVRLDLESNQNSQLRFKSQARADNADTVSDTSYVSLSSSQLLTFAFDSQATWYPAQGGTGTQLNVSFPYTHSALVNITNSTMSQCGFVVFQGTVSQISGGGSQTPVLTTQMKAANLTRGDTTWSESVSANAGDTVKFDVSYENTALNSTATNGRLRITFPTAAQNYIVPTVYFLSDNATTVNDPATVTVSNASSYLTFADTALWYANSSAAAQTVTIQKSYGVVEINLGNVQNCQGHVVFQASLSGTVTTSPNLSISKTVRNITAGQTSWTDSTSANAGDRLGFRIDIGSIGTGAAQNVIARDILPTDLTYVGNVHIDNSYSSSNIVSGINLGSMYGGQTRSIVFEAQIPANYGTTTYFVNRAIAYADNVYQKEDSATVNVQGAATAQLFAIDKLVRNLTRNESIWQNSVEAYPGERVEYYIRVNNTGSTVLNNVVVKDTIPSSIILLGNIKVDNYAISGDIVNGINIGTLTTNQTKIVTFEAQVASESNFLFGLTSLVNIATATANNNSKIDSATVVVNRKAVAGAATEVETGLKDDLMDYLLIPVLLAMLGVFIFRNQLFKLDKLLVLRGAENRTYRSQKLLDQKINEIRDRENLK
ncbi:MAG: hypothetical protein WC397_00290 [Candidatus Paceibacterota bacterium]|jgi:uncharacterized repeat protein (TIGR01451 family)